ncbi:hypothetical protein Desal_0203 [Maridesulfovibrio salexigens DSM 2638]|uniref:Uncharacterized protein n=1 Tax=Maridesulfovibrio salexigens (strain ATCC 14822 / DSM 2638 / NCIMB 8403 / VKM B-1763) TaxID=526222 RepID=C6BVQ9_MARSD|nr:hypothetical protein Desal_0203 [Maridesulfovibrio salexigens DSM 2638]
MRIVMLHVALARLNKLRMVIIDGLKAGLHGVGKAYILQAAGIESRSRKIRAQKTSGKSRT